MACGVVLMLAGVAAALRGIDRMEFPDRAHRQRRRVEFPVRRRHHAGDDLLPPERARQDPGAQRPPGFRTTATSSFMAGFLQDRWGWQPLNWFSVLLMLAAAAAGDMASLPAAGL